MSDDTKRPYPEGLAWDEAWRRLSRRRAQMADLMKLRLGDRIEFRDKSGDTVRSIEADAECSWLSVNRRWWKRDGSFKQTGTDYRDITAIHPAEPAADGWVKFASGHCKDFGNVTACVGEYAGGIACCHFLPPDIPRDSIAWAMGPDAPRNAPLLMEWLDAAYARHCEPKPVLVWDDSLAWLKRAKHYHHDYIVREDGNRWAAEHHTPTSGTRLAWEVTEDDAKAACERHARGE